MRTKESRRKKISLSIYETEQDIEFVIEKMPLIIEILSSIFPRWHAPAGYGRISEKSALMLNENLSSNVLLPWLRRYTSSTAT